MEEEGCQEAPGGGAAPGHCLTCGPAAALWAAASARAARTQLASTTNPDGSSGAASSTAAFTDVVPRSMPRVTDGAAMAMGTSVGLVSCGGAPATTSTTIKVQRPSHRGGASLAKPSATLNVKAYRLPIGRGRRSPAHPRSGPSYRRRGNRRRDLKGTAPSGWSSGTVVTSAPPGQPLPRSHK